VDETACTVASHRVKYWEVVAEDSHSDITLLCISCARVSGNSQLEAEAPGSKMTLVSARQNRTLEPCSNLRLLPREG
jgi:hypothetical protein